MADKYKEFMGGKKIEKEIRKNGEKVGVKFLDGTLVISNEAV